jgi:hypothetical protein
MTGASGIDPNDADPSNVESAADTPAVRPSAAAASRARRIGGRIAGAQPVEPLSPAADAALDSERDTEPDTAPAAEPDTVAAAGPAEAPGAPHWLTWAPAAILGIGAVIMAVLTLTISHSVWWGPTPPGPPSQKQTSVVRDQVLAAAKSCVITINTYSYTSLDTYESKALACTTGGFTDKLHTAIEQLIKPNAPKFKASQTIQVPDAGVVSVSSTQWTVLLFAQTTSINTSTPKTGEVGPFSATVEMQKVNGQWLVAALSTV